MSANLYMHTIDGRPGMFDGDQVVFLSKETRVEFDDVFVYSIDDIRKQQEASRQFRINELGTDDLGVYDYIRIKNKRF